MESVLIGNLDSMSQSDHRKYYDVTMDPIDSSAIEPAPELNVDYGKAKGVCRKFGDVRTSVIEAKDSLPPRFDVYVSSEKRSHWHWFLWSGARILRSECAHREAVKEPRRRH